MTDESTKQSDETEGAHCLKCLDFGYEAKKVRGIVGFASWAESLVPEDFIPWCDCDAQEDAKLRYRERFERARTVASHRTYRDHVEKSGIPERYLDLNHDTILDDNRLANAKILGVAMAIMFGDEGRVQFSELASYVNNSILADKYKDDVRPARPGMFLTGDVGRGKSVMAAIALTDRMWYSRRRGLWIGWHSWLAKVQSAYGSPKADRMIRDAQRAPILVIDDLGDSELRGQMTDDKNRLLWLVINHRHEHQMETIITSNLSASELAQQFWTKTVERILELCAAGKVNGLNLREENI